MWWEFLGRFLAGKRELVSEGMEELYYGRLWKTLCCPDVGEGQRVWDCVPEAVLGNSLLALVHHGEQWDSFVAEGAPLNLGCHLHLEPSCTALLWPPVSAWWLSQKLLIYFVCSCPYPSKLCIAAPFWTSDYHGNHKCSLVGFPWAWRLQVSGSLVDVSHLRDSFLPFFSQLFALTFFNVW